MRRNFRLAALPLLVAVMSLAGAMFCQAADLLDRIKEKKEIVVAASEARYAPFEYVDDGKIVGYDVDIFDKMMTALPGVKVTRLDLPFPGLAAWPADEQVRRHYHSDHSDCAAVQTL